MEISSAQFSILLVHGMFGMAGSCALRHPLVIFLLKQINIIFISEQIIIGHRSQKQISLLSLNFYCSKLL
jgi:hypothetical protein